MHRLSYSNVTATVALFLALGGTSVAATTMVNGKNIKRGTIPADRVKAHSLGGAQINAATLGVVPHATRADSAGHADAASHADASTTADTAAKADSATKAGDADTVGGLSPDALMAGSRVQAGSADGASPTVQPILDYPDFGLRVETDGDADNDHTVVLRNMTSKTIALPEATGGYNLFAGATVSWGIKSSPWDAEYGQMQVLAVNPKDASDELLVDCWFPISGNTYCTGTRSH